MTAVALAMPPASPRLRRRRPASTLGRSRPALDLRMPAVDTALPDDATDLGDCLRRVASGDRAAFETLYRTTSARLFGICLRVLRDRDEAEDVLQDVYVAVWNKADRFDAGKAAASTWLGMVARNRAIDRVRARPAGTAALDDALPLADDAPAPAQDAEHAGERRRLDACLDELEPQRQRLIRAAFFDGRTYDELSRRDGSPLGTVKSWIRRGLMQLRACLDR